MGDHVTDLDQLRAQLAKAEAEREDLAEALEFYADRETYGTAEIAGCPLSGDRDADGDLGHRARMVIGMVYG